MAAAVAEPQPTKTSPPRPAGPSPLLVPSGSPTAPLITRARRHTSPTSASSQQVRWLPFTTVLPPPTYVKGMKLPDVEEREEEGRSVPIGELRGKLRLELRTLSLPLSLPKRSDSDDSPPGSLSPSSSPPSSTSPYLDGQSLKPTHSPPAAVFRTTKKALDDIHDIESTFTPSQPRLIKVPVIGLTRKLSKAERKREEERRKGGKKSCLKTNSHSPPPSDGEDAQSPISTDAASGVSSFTTTTTTSTSSHSHHSHNTPKAVLEGDDPSTAVEPDQVADLLRLQRTPSAKVARLRECCVECHSGLSHPSLTPSLPPSSTQLPTLSTEEGGAEATEVVDETDPEVHWTPAARKSYEEAKLKRELREKAGLGPVEATSESEWASRLSRKRGDGAKQP